MNWGNYLRSFLPRRTPAPLAEKVRSGLAGGLGILLLMAVLHHLPRHNYPLIMLASMAASAVLLYAAPHSPFSQPWNLIGSHLISALIGFICSQLIPEPAIAGGIAVGMAIFLMYLLNCLHPPGGATALLMVLSSPQFHSMGWQWVGWIVVANAGLSLLLAVIINNLIPGRHYPLPVPTPPPVVLNPVIAPEQADIEWALTQMDSVIDVSTEDLTEIYAKALTHARSRYENATK